MILAAPLGVGKSKSSLPVAIEKLAIAGEQAGFTVDQMIQLVSLGFTADALLEVIAWRLEHMGTPIAAIASFSSWIA